MSIEWVKASEAPLYGEHLLLGGIYDEDEPLLAAPHHYGNVPDEPGAFGKGCALCDLSGMSITLVSGPGSDAFVSAVCAGAPHAIGECRCSALLSGDGALTATPLVMRTGDTEYLLCDPTERGMAILPWLQFVASIEQQGYRPYASVHVEDVSASLHPLLLWGPHASDVLSDYVSASEDLPRDARVDAVMLDRIHALVAVPDFDANPCYLILVPPAAARVFWRSLLSFPIVTPVGHAALTSKATGALPWARQALSQAQLSPDKRSLERWGLVRPDGGFIGARALASADGAAHAE